MTIPLPFPAIDAESLIPLGAESTAPPAQSPFALLARALTECGISYCYWKSARRLPEILEGRADLDLLVARTDGHKAVETLLGCGFKLAPDIAGRDDPDIMSFLGFDETRGVILHAHVHFRLVIGKPLLKRFHLPVEAKLLARSQMAPRFNLRILAPADEALLLFLRANLEYGALDPVQYGRRSQIDKKLRRDFAEVKPELDIEMLRQSAGQVFSPELTREIVQAIAGPDPMRRRRGLTMLITHELSSFCLFNSAESLVRWAARTAMFLFCAFNRRYLRWPRPWGRHAAGGGAFIAFVGVDGSGKSSAAANICRWLGREIDVFPAYFGTGDGPSSLVFLPFKLAASLAGRFITIKPKGASHGQISDREPGRIYSVLFAIWACAVALDKRSKLTAARRAARRGFIVVADRYPQNEIQNFNDGPLLHRLPSAPDWLRRFEASIYRIAECAPPDLVVRLNVGRDVVARREPGMNCALIDERIAKLADLRFNGAKMVSIDAQRPIDEVTRLIKREVWAIL